MKQFHFCELCKRNHKDNLKQHKFTQRHSQAVKNLLDHQLKKITSLSKWEDDNMVWMGDQPGWRQLQPKFWCRFCQCDVNLESQPDHDNHAEKDLDPAESSHNLPVKSTTSDRHSLKSSLLLPWLKKETDEENPSLIQTSVPDYGDDSLEGIVGYPIFVHLASQSHIHKVEYFWNNEKVHRLQEEYQMEQFYWDQHRFTTFQERARGLKARSLEELKESRLVHSEVVKKLKETSFQQDSKSLPPVQYEEKLPTMDSKKRKFNSGTVDDEETTTGILKLTVIQTPKNAKEYGTIHNPGSVPPWLRNQPSTSTRNEAGPSLEAFLAYKKQEEKKKLNPNRVGATFNRDQTKSKKWLPNFGGVWSSGPRSETRKNFQDEGNKS